ncbi:ASCH domain-containing protein [Streptomyces sp. SID8366]|uniref:ASCH domain-containing protein n=1 Tax=unclassified Streptomyces TaxID=2593676 RepID=UPI000DB923FC|nr:ASCH domain-containing protein [Streptomyces sp. PsTaAH-130]MYU07472.1 ASCH domain-containing protein [Streptomyces sp. SID8366]MYU65476.1 ASCH domain-containing protein [Streptomyces sp. SID69]
MNEHERSLLMSLHPRYAAAILDGRKSVELRRQRVAVPPGTKVILYATSPVMALVGTATVTAVEVGTPSEIWKAHKAHGAISRRDYLAYMEGAEQASALLLDAASPLSDPVPLAHLRAGGSFHPPQSYRYVDPDTLRGWVQGHPTAEEVLREASPRPRAGDAKSAAKNQAEQSTGSPLGGSMVLAQHVAA